MSKDNGKTRNWTFVIYPESMPENWEQIIEEFYTEFLISPLHDKDINADGTIKKPHYHVALFFSGVKSYEQILEFTKPLCGTIPQKIYNTRAIARYFLHLDNPEKAQYKKEDLKFGGGIDLEEILKPNSSQRYELISEIMDFIDDNEIIEITELLKYARNDRKSDWFPILCDNSMYIIGNYVKSLRHQLHKKEGLDVLEYVKQHYTLKKDSPE